MIMKVRGRTPRIADTAFVHKSAVITGDVEVKEGANIWPCAVARGDLSKITIGKNTSVQDNSVLHTDSSLPLTIGDDVIIGHNVNLHSCEVGEGSLVGIGAILLNGVKVGKNCVVAAGSLLPPGKEYPDQSMIMGSPAKVVRQLEESEVENQQTLVAHYQEMVEYYKETEEEIL